MMTEGHGGELLVKISTFRYKRLLQSVYQSIKWDLL